MKKSDIQVYKETKLNVVTLVKDILPEDFYVNTVMNNPLALNIQFNSMYKNRYISPFLKEIIENYSDEDTEEFIEISAEGLLIIKHLLSDRFSLKWKKLYELSVQKYDALSPFDIELKEDSTDTLSTKKDRTSYKDNDSTYGFNSTESVPSDSADGISEREYERENPKHREYTRKGNIGNTSRQELVEQERKVLEYQIWDTIFFDTASVLCRDTYKLD